MVRVIRTFRPLVIYSRFSGTPADGHGQHQMAGYLTPLAFKAAGDPTQFPEQIAEGLRPWQPKKLYRGAGFRPDPANAPTISVQTGVMDGAIGRSYAEIAAEGRSQHKSQEMGGIEPLGPAASGPDPAGSPGGCAGRGGRAIHLRRPRGLGCRSWRRRRPALGSAPVRAHARSPTPRGRR